MRTSSDVIDSRRRGFLRRSGLAAVPLGLLVAAPGARAEIEPLPSCVELPLDRSQPGVARGELVAAPARVRIAGREREVLAYNGSVPGPLIRLRDGERLRLRFVNGLTQASNLHFHGLFVTPEGTGDNAWLQVPPGASFDYDFTVAGGAGLHWYHPHVHGNTARQQFAGLAGAIVVEDDRRLPAELDAAEEQVIVLRDFEFDGERIARHRSNEWAVGKEGPLLTLNGASAPVLQAKSALQRLRLVNASNGRFWRLRRHDGEPFHLLAIDGRYLAAPIPQTELLLVPGARVDALLVMENVAVQLDYLASPRRGHTFTAIEPVLTLLPPPRAAPVAIPTRLVEPMPFDVSAAGTERRVLLSLLNICGLPYAPDRIDIETRLGASEIWQVENVDVMDHPFHLHTWHFRVLALNGQPYPVAAWWDSFSTRPGDRLTIGLRFDRYTGRSLYHCHIAEHVDRGMMAVLRVNP